MGTWDWSGNVIKLRWMFSWKCTDMGTWNRSGNV